MRCVPDPSSVGVLVLYGRWLCVFVWKQPLFYHRHKDQKTRALLIFRLDSIRFALLLECVGVGAVKRKESWSCKFPESRAAYTLANHLRLPVNEILRWCSTDCTPSEEKISFFSEEIKNSLLAGERKMRNGFFSGSVPFHHSCVVGRVTSSLIKREVSNFFETKTDCMQTFRHPVARNAVRLQSGGLRNYVWFGYFYAPSSFQGLFTRLNPPRRVEANGAGCFSLPLEDCVSIESKVGGAFMKEIITFPGDFVRLKIPCEFRDMVIEIYERKAMENWCKLSESEIFFGKLARPIVRHELWNM